jgi:hypothetical protein
MKKYLLLSSAVILNGVLAIAQQPGFDNEQRTSEIVGVATGQTARWNVLYPTVPAPVLQPVCSVVLNIADADGNILKTITVSQFTAGKSASLDLNADTDLTGRPRAEIHAYGVAPSGCKFMATLELIDNTTQKTVLVAGSKQTYPWTAALLADNAR